jgi:hypothetical protein
LPKIKSLHHVQQARNPLRNLQPFKAARRELAKNKSSTPPTASKKALKKPSSDISK